MLAATPAAAVAPDAPIRAIQHNGEQRLFALYVPRSYTAGRDAPVIIALHGRYSSGKALHALSGLYEIAEQHGAIVVYPEPAGTFWDDGAHALLARRETPRDDVGFISALVEALAHDYRVDRTRVFAIGHDQGGAMAFRLACTLPLAGVAVVNGAFWNVTRDACARSTPLLLIRGARDDALPLASQAGIGEGGAGEILGALETVAFWRERNGCAAVATRRRGDSAFYSQCSGGADVAYVEVSGGGHDWFRDRPGQKLNTRGVNAAQLAGDFFFERARFELPRTGGARRSRSATVYVPPTYDPARATPLVMLLHGRPGSGVGMAAITEMNRVADRHGFLVVYPDGLDGWNVLDDLPGVSPHGYAPDDAGFFAELLDDLALDLNIDPARAYLGGFSNGGLMTFRMACVNADRFAAFAAVGGALFNRVRDACRRGRPAPILIMHGTGDISVPYDGVTMAVGQNSERVRVSTDIPGVVHFFARRNGCDTAGERSDFVERGGSPGSRVSRLNLRQCTSGAEVSFYVIEGGGHNWPGLPGVISPEVAGIVNTDINAGEEIWAFFNRHALRPRR